MSTPLRLSVLIGLICASSAHAEEAFRQHEAHVHGSVEMNIAQDGHDLLIEMTAPGMDVVGFEHLPRNEQEHQRIEQAAHQLENAPQLFALTAQADCHLEHVAVQHPALDEDDHDEHHEEHEHHDHDRHDHDEHDHDAHQGHDHDDHAQKDEHHDHDEHEHEHEHEHSEFTVQYSYHCESVNKLDSLTTTWFTQFPSTHTITANVFTDKEQTSATLSAKQASVKL